MIGVQGLSDLTGVHGLSDLTQYVEDLAKVVERPYFRSSQYTFLFLEEGGLKDLPGVSAPNSVAVAMATQTTR